MQALRKIGVAVVGTMVAVGAYLVPAAPGGALPAPDVYSVGVDMATPQGHNIAAVDYFPRGDAAHPLAVHQGDVIGFHWNAGQPDQLHTVTLGSTGETPNDIYGRPENAAFGPDADEPGTLQFAFPAPTFPPPGSGAPIACGDAATPCSYNGSGEVSSGAMPTAPGGSFYVKVNATAGQTVNFVCLIHPGMVGSFDVVSGASTTPATAASEATAQTNEDVAEGLAAEAAAGPATSTTNADGTKTWTALAGTAGPHTEVLEMLPLTLNVKPGDKVRWKTGTIKDVHTVTFPFGSGSDAVDPFPPPVCEAAAGDSPAPGGPPPDFGCPHGTSENHFLAGPMGPTTISPHAYRTVATDGGVFNFGDAGDFGSEGGIRLNSPVVATATTPSANGYWNAASDGGIFAHGDAPFLGSMGGTKLNKPVVGFTATPDGGGYLEVASDGGVFNFGDAEFLGSMGGTALNSPVVGISAAQGFAPPGYWEAAADGGVFTFGGSEFMGSMGGTKLNSPVVGIASTPDAGGYWLVAADGGIFNFGDAPFLGSMGGTKLNSPVVGMAPTPSGFGYWLVAADGGIFSFGDAQFYGSMGGTKLNKPMIGISALPATVATSGVIANPPAPFATTTADYTFTGPGVFTFQCRIHDHMVGAVVTG